MLLTEFGFIRFVLALVALSVFVLYVWGMTGLTLAGPKPTMQAALYDERSPIVVHMDTSRTMLVSKFEELDYSLSDVRQGRQEVPRVFLTTLSRDLQEVQSVHQRKRLFIKVLLPLILQANEDILTQRRRLKGLLVRESLGEKFTGEEAQWLVALANNHGVEAGNFNELLQRVDVIPPSLALAQAAAESGWGTSRFAVEGNAVFGQYTYSQGAGLVPERRDEGQTHEVRIFDGLDQSVVTYMMNLNTHWAYEEFRIRRMELRQNRALLSGSVLAGTLQIYSERGVDYIETIREIIRGNDLQEFDRSRLDRIVLADSPRV